MLTYELLFIYQENHISTYTGTHLRGDPVTTAGEFDVLKLYWESNVKSRWKIFMSHWAHPPLPRFLISFEEVRKERGSRGSRRWFLFEADSWELWKWPLPFSAWRCALSPNPLALWLDGEETVRERAEAGPLCSPDGQEVV